MQPPLPARSALTRELRDKRSPEAGLRVALAVSKLSVSETSRLGVETLTRYVGSRLCFSATVSAGGSRGPESRDGTPGVPMNRDLCFPRAE